jgi:RNA polymerase sigma-70 factor (ECF subfamily)
MVAPGRIIFRCQFFSTKINAVRTSETDLGEDLNRLEDHELVGLLGPSARRSGRAMSVLYRRHHRQALQLARRRLGDSQRAEEVVQEVFLDLWLRPERYSRARGSLTAFLAIQVRCRSLDRVRADRARDRREVRHARLSPPGGPDEAAVEMADRVRSALQVLPEKERVPLGLVLDGVGTYRQVAETLGWPEGTVKARIRSGLSHIREQLGQPTAA